MYHLGLQAAALVSARVPSAAAHFVPPIPQFSARVVAARCSAVDPFETTLRAVLAEADEIGATNSVKDHLAWIDEKFIPSLGARIDACTDKDEAFKLLAIMEAFEAIYPSSFGIEATAGQVETEQASLDDESEDQQRIDAILQTHWNRFDGTIDDDEESYVDMFDLPEGSSRPYVGERPSAYGEVTRRGARQLFRAMGLRDREGMMPPVVFADLGSGAGRLVAQAWLELPRVEQAIGVELAPSRHRAAVRAWGSVVAAGEAEPTFVRQCAPHAARPMPEFRLASMLETNLTGVTHCYVASLCMADTLLDALWDRIRSSAPSVSTIASLRAFRAAEAHAALSHVTHVQMSWNREGSPGAEVFIYRL